MSKIDLNKRLNNPSPSLQPVEQEKRKKEPLQLKEKLPQGNAKMTEEPQPELSSEELDQQLLMEEAARARAERVSQKRRQIIGRIATIVIVVLCVYIVLLIYGALITEYVYDENGAVVPQIMSLEEIQDLEDFNTLASQYRQARTLYEEVLVVDYRVEAGQEDPLLVAPEYENILDEIEQLSIQLEAISLPSKYNQTLEMLTYWVQNDIAIYCQNRSRAISQNNSEYAANADEYESLMYSDFSLITSNIATIGNSVVGANITDIVEWSPENYVREAVGSVY